MITDKPYLFFNLPWDCLPDKARNPRYWHNALTALAFIAAPLISDVVTLPLISLHLTDYLPPSTPVISSYKRLKAQAKQHILMDWGSDPVPEYYPYLSAVRPHPFMRLGKFIAGRIHQMRSGKSYLAAHTF